MKLFTADWHLFHTNIDQYCERPFRNEVDASIKIRKIYNECVHEDDEVWVIGDVTMLHSNHNDRIRKWLEKTNGTKHLVLGNHDDWRPRVYENIGFTTIHTAFWFKHPDFKYTFYMMHDPSTYTVIENDPNAVLLCGHIHKLFKHLLPEKRVINVGVDVWNYQPVSFLQILDLLESNNV